MIILILIIILLQILTYLIIRGGTMNKTPQELENDLNAEQEWIKEQVEKKENNGGKKFWKKQK